MLGGRVLRGGGLLCTLAVALALASGPAVACTGLVDGPDGVVTDVYDGNTLRLDNGIVVRLSGTVAPLPDGRRAGAAAQPLSGEATAALRRLVLDQPVALKLDAEETDRYGHMLAQVFLEDSGQTWVQQRLAAQGMARVEPQPNARLCLDELIAAEAAARANGLGIWRDPYYSVRDAADPAALADRAGYYELIEGEIVGTGESRGRVYLDFGRVWKDDVTATIDQKARGLFVAAGIDPLSLKGERVRVRGWLDQHDGPEIALAVPEQLEVLEPK